jgi:hypothetical protein
MSVRRAFGHGAPVAARRRSTLVPDPPCYEGPADSSSVHGQREALLRYSDVQTALGGVPEASERRAVRRLPELLKRPLANLPNPLPCHAEQRADLFEGHGL